MVILPRTYLSYSAWETWRKSKQQFRDRYYIGVESFQTRETIFGKKIAKLLEDNEKHPILSKVPRGEKAEFRIETEINGIPILAVLDSFTPDTYSLFEYKTGRVIWDQQRVNQHMQLSFYAACIKAKYGFFDPHVLLIWLETELVGRNEIINGIDFSNDDDRDKEVKMTGKIEVFTRKITDEEIRIISESIRKSAEEISDDWELWKRTH